MKVITSIYIDDETLRLAKTHGLNLSQMLETVINYVLQSAEFPEIDILKQNVSLAERYLQQTKDALTKKIDDIALRMKLIEKLKDSNLDDEIRRWIGLIEKGGDDAKLAFMEYKEWSPRSQTTCEQFIDALRHYNDDLSKFNKP